MFLNGSWLIIKAFISQYVQHNYISLYLKTFFFTSQVVKGDIELLSSITTILLNEPISQKTLNLLSFWTYRWDREKEWWMGKKNHDWWTVNFELFKEPVIMTDPSRKGHRGNWSIPGKMTYCWDIFSSGRWTLADSRLLNGQLKKFISYCDVTVRPSGGIITNYTFIANGRCIDLCQSLPEDKKKTESPERNLGTHELLWQICTYSYRQYTISMKMST